MPTCKPRPLVPAPPHLPSEQFTFVDIATLFGVLCGYVSTFLAWSYTRAGRKLGMLQVGLYGEVQPGNVQRVDGTAWYRINCELCSSRLALCMHPAPAFSVP